MDVSIQITPARRNVKASALEGFVRRAARHSGLAKDAHVGVLITDSKEMMRLNRHFRAKNEATDVLSFPAATEGINALGNHAGDIAVCADIAGKNARRYGHSLADEVKILLLHGILHLDGYDHETDGGEMARLEITLRKKLGLPETLIHRTRGARAAPSRPKSKVKNGLRAKAVK